jgi:hypothetical protein
VGGNQAIQDRGHIYRYLSWERAVDVFQNKRLFFARPQTWPDPYEIQLRHRGSNQLFASCWCQTAISDAMWRTCSPPTGDAVRIGVKKDALTAAVKAWADEAGFGCRSRLVDYDSAENVRTRTRELARKLRFKFDLLTATDALFLKREAFRHENEWRILIFGEGVPPGDPGTFIPIDPPTVIASVLLDPRAPTDLVEQRSQFFKKALGYRKSVRASVLDRPPEPIVVQ